MDTNKVYFGFTIIAETFELFHNDMYFKLGKSLGLSQMKLSDIITSEIDLENSIYWMLREVLIKGNPMKNL